MGGLLDFLMQGQNGQGGGLLGFLGQNGPQPQMAPSDAFTLASDGGLGPPPQSMMQAPAMMQQPMSQAAPQMPPQMQQQPPQGLLDPSVYARMAMPPQQRGGLMGILGGGNPLDAIHGSLQGMADPEGKHRQQAFQNYIALRGMEDKPTFGQVGEDAFGGKQYGFINAPQQKVTPYTPTPAGGGAMPGAPGAPAQPLSGEDYLNGLPRDIAPLVKGVANYEINPTTLSNKGGHRERILSAAAQYNPNFDGALAPARFAAIKEFNAGGPSSPANVITAGNTAIQHLGLLSDTSQKVGGFSSLGPLNSLANAANAKYQGMSNSPDMVEYNNALGRFAEEATKFYRGVGGSETDIQRALGEITAAQSPEARNRAIATQAELMQSKINALQERWKQATGPEGWNKITKDFPIVQPKSAAALDQIYTRDGRAKYTQGSAEPGASPPSAATPPPAPQNAPVPAAESQAPPVRVTSIAQANALPPGTRFLDPKGIPRVVPPRAPMPSGTGGLY